MNRNNGIKDLPPRDKASLLRRNDQGKNAKEPRGKDLRDDLVEGVVEADGPEHVHRVSSQDLGNEDQEGGIKFFQKVSSPKKFLNYLRNILLDHILVNLKKEARETIRAGSFIPQERKESLVIFL